LTTREKAVVIAMMTSVSFSSNITISLVLPFLPQEINALGLPGQLLTGFIFAIFPFMILVLSPLCNLLAKRLGRVFLLYAGVPLQTVTVVVFGLSKMACKNPKGVIGMFLVSRGLQGFGAAMANLAIFAIVAETFPNSLGKVMGLNEVIIGIGFMTGPVLGSLLYTSGGFSLPFLAASGLLALSFPFVILYHRLHNKRRLTITSYHHIGSSGDRGAAVGAEENLVDFTSGEEKQNGMSFLDQVWGVLTWRVMVTAAVLLLGTGAFGWVETILSLHLQDDLNVKDKYIGVIFAVINVTYSGFGPFVGALADTCGYKPIMVGGLMLSGLSFVLLGPAATKVGDEAGLQAQRYWEVALLGLFGAFQSLCMIPTLPAMKESVGGKLDQHTVNTIVMIFNQFQNTGLMFSPPVSGALSPAIGWEYTMAIYGSVCLGVGIFASAVFWTYGGVPEEEAVYEPVSPYASTEPLLVPRTQSDLEHMESSHSFSRSHSLQSPINYCSPRGG